MFDEAIRYRSGSVVGHPSRFRYSPNRYQSVVSEGEREEGLCPTLDPERASDLGGGKRGRAELVYQLKLVWPEGLSLISYGTHPRAQSEDVSGIPW